MATTTYLSNPFVTIKIGSGSPIDYSDQCTALELVSSAEALDVTAFGDTARKYAAGLRNNSVTMTMFLSYGTSEVEALQAAVGGLCELVMLPKDANAAADNPKYTLTGCYLESFTPITASVGEMATVELEFQGGTLARTIVHVP